MRVLTPDTVELAFDRFAEFDGVPGGDSEGVVMEAWAYRREALGLDDETSATIGRRLAELVPSATFESHRTSMIAVTCVLDAIMLGAAELEPAEGE